MTRFIVSAQYMVGGTIQERTFTVRADSILEAIRQVPRSGDLIQVTRVRLDTTPEIVDPFSLPEEADDKNV